MSTVIDMNQGVIGMVAKLDEITSNIITKNPHIFADSELYEGGESLGDSIFHIGMALMEYGVKIRERES